MDKSEARKKNDRKAKYNRGFKNKSDEKQENTEKKVLLPSNWSKYEISETNEDKYLDSTNFDLLLKEPTSNYSFFKFKSEQNWDNDVKSRLELNNYFMLDLILLSEGTACVPFSKRQDLNESLFSCTDIENVHKNLDRKLVHYNKYLNKRFSQKSFNKFILEENTNELKPASADKTEEIQPTVTEIPEVLTDTKNFKQTSKQDPEKMKVVKEIVSTEDVHFKKELINSENYKDDINELLSLREPELSTITIDSEIKAEDPLTVSTITKTTPVNMVAQDLEQWLDDILDD